MNVQEKTIHPENPYGFNYNEIGLPAVQYAQFNLQQKLNEIRQTRLQMEDKFKKSNFLTPLLRSRQGGSILELKIAEKYFSELLLEADVILKLNNISYQQTIEYTYYFSRAFGHFENRTDKLSTRIFLQVDRFFQGYQQLSMAKEYSLFQNRKFEIFQKKSAIEGFRVAEKQFASAFSDQNFLQTVFVPSAVPIERDVLMRLMSKEINIIGLTAESVEADGFKRPSGDFWMHDIRHESSKNFETEIYRGRFDFSEIQLHELDRLQDQWYYELTQEINLIADSNLREAVDLMAFNFHHDRGFPLIPSLWTRRQRSQDYISFALIFQLEISGQTANYKSIIKNTLKARKWLDHFWQNREASEQNVLTQYRNEGLKK